MQRGLWRAALCVAVVAATYERARCEDRAPAKNAPELIGSQPQGLSIPAYKKLPKDKVVLSFGQYTWTVGDLLKMLEDVDPGIRVQVDSDPKARRQLAEQFINIKLLSDEARKMKLDETKRVQIVYEQLLSNALAVAYSEQEIENKKFYQEHPSYFTQYTVRRIMIAFAGGGVAGAIRSEAEARAKAEGLKKSLDKGDDFVNEARTESDDKNNAATGGEMTLNAHAIVIDPLEKLAFSMKDNDISEPLKMPYGFEILQMRSRSIPNYDEAKARIPNCRIEVLLDSLKKTNKPEFDDSFFGSGSEK